jgi:hypothetical protein
MSDRSGGGSGDEVGATALLHAQPIVGAGGGDLGVPSGIVLATKQVSTLPSLPYLAALACARARCLRVTDHDRVNGPIDAPQKRPKRKQVKRACSNCRKSHSGTPTANTGVPMCCVLTRMCGGEQAAMICDRARAA